MIRATLVQNLGPKDPYRPTMGSENSIILGLKEKRLRQSHEQASVACGPL